MHERLGCLLVCPVNDAVKGLSGNAHALCRVLIVESLIVRQSHGLQFVGGKCDLLNLAQRNPRRLEIIRGRAVFDSSGTGWPRHGLYITPRQRFEKKLRFDLQSRHSYELMLYMETISSPIAGQLRIALPMQGGSFSEHFGGASHFRLIDADRGSRSIISQADVQAPEHVPGAFPSWLAKQGVQAVIVGSIGQRAVQLFTENSIQVFTAQGGASPEELVAQQLEGILAQPGLAKCCPGHGHDHGNEHSSCAH